MRRGRRVASGDADADAESSSLTIPTQSYTYIQGVSELAIAGLGRRCNRPGGIYTCTHPSIHKEYLGSHTKEKP